MAEEKEAKKDFNYVVRIVGTDLDGNKPLIQALRKVKGVSFMLANAICKVSKVNKNKKVGYFSEDQVSKVEKALNEFSKSNIPAWMLNRRKDPEEGTDKHILGADLKFTQDTDIRFMRKIKCYRGMRHSYGLPSRGQRTKSNFRRNKGKVMGVAKKKGKK